MFSLIRIFSAIGMPTPVAPDPKAASGDPVGGVFGPWTPQVGELWYVVLHYVLPLVAIGAFVLMLVAGARGDKAHMSKARSALISIPAAVFYLAVIFIIANQVMTAYGLSS